jgi:MFS family permease
MTQDSQTALYCYVHPQRETLLRCNKCERPICTSCAVRTPTGYRCKECVSGQQKIFNTAQWWDYPLAITISGVLSFLGSLITSFIGFFSIFLASLAGIVIAEAVRRALRKRRSKWLPGVTAGAALVGALISPLVRLVMLIVLSAATGSSEVWLGAVSALLMPVIYAVLVVSTVYYRLKGIRI